MNRNRFQIINLVLNSTEEKKLLYKGISKDNRELRIGLGKWTNLYFDHKQMNRSIFTLPKKLYRKGLRNHSQNFNGKKLEIIKSTETKTSGFSYKKFWENFHHSKGENKVEIFPKVNYKINKLKQNHNKFNQDTNFESRSLIVDRVYSDMIGKKNLKSDFLRKLNNEKVKKVKKHSKSANFNCQNLYEKGIRRNESIQKLNRMAFQTMKHQISKFQLDIPFIPRHLFRTQNKSIKNREIKITKEIVKLNSHTNFNQFRNRYKLINFLKSPINRSNLYNSLNLTQTYSPKISTENKNGQHIQIPNQEDIIISTDKPQTITKILDSVFKKNNQYDLFYKSLKKFGKMINIKKFSEKTYEIHKEHLNNLKENISSSVIHKNPFQTNGKRIKFYKFLRYNLLEKIMYERALESQNQNN